MTTTTGAETARVGRDIELKLRDFVTTPDYQVASEANQPHVMFDDPRENTAENRYYGRDEREWTKKDASVPPEKKCCCVIV